MDATPAVPRAEDFNDYLAVNWVDYDARFPLQIWLTDKQQSRWIPQQIDPNPSTQPPEHLPLHRSPTEDRDGRQDETGPDRLRSCTAKPEACLLRT